MRHSGCTVYLAAGCWVTLSASRDSLVTVGKLGDFMELFFLISIHFPPDLMLWSLFLSAMVAFLALKLVKL